MIWQPLSYLFVHGDLAHLFFNMLGITILGNQIEALWGTKKYLQFFLLCGIFAGILSAIYNPNINYIGASASLCGLLLIYAKLYPNRELLLWFLFPIKIKNLLFCPCYTYFYHEVKFWKTHPRQCFVQVCFKLFGFMDPNFQISTNLGNLKITLFN